MYGLVNKAVEQLVLVHHGEAVWKEIAKKANISQPFIAMDTYPDQVTFDLVAAASEVLDAPASDILEAFGEHWIRFTVEDGYEGIMSLYGTTVQEFLSNMDTLHAQIKLSFPELRPPSISCEEQADGQLLVSYHSERAGLAPMLVGLLKGLGKRFSTPVNIEYLDTVVKENSIEFFLVSFEEHEAAA